MWIPLNKGADRAHKRISDNEMSEAFANGLDNGWKVKRNSDGTVSAFKNGRFIRDYAHIPDNG